MYIYTYNMHKMYTSSYVQREKDKENIAPLESQS